VFSFNANLFVNRSKAHGKETGRERLREPKPYEVGAQISCGVYAQRTPQAVVGQLRLHLEEVFWELARRKESTIEEGHLRPNHVHMLLSIPPK
jgi:Transposase IS200 like